MGSVYKQRGKWYWYKVRLPGDKKYSAFPCCPPGAKTATTNKTLALAIAQRIYKEKYLANPAPKLDSLLEEFKEKELRRNTRTYVVDKISTLKDFFSVANISAPLDISAPLVRDYLTHLETLGKAAKTVNNKRASISRFCQWLKKDKGAIDRNPVTDTDAVKVIRSEIHFLTRPQMDAVLELAPAAGVFNEVAFAFYAALRLSELRRLQWSDIRTNSAGGVIVLPNTTARRTKARTVQSVPINARLAAVIDGMTRGKPKDNVFAYRRKRLWPDLLDPIKAKVPELKGWHDFRRTAGSLLVQAGVELYLVSKFLRHSSVTTTEKHYAHLRPDVHRREAIDLL